MSDRNSIADRVSCVNRHDYRDCPHCEAAHWLDLDADKLESQAKRIAELEAANDKMHEVAGNYMVENERLRYGHSEIIRECSQEGCDGDPWDTFQAIAIAALKGER